MPQSQRLSSVIPFVAIERPACPKCKAPMMLVSIELARPGVDLHTFECAICNRVHKTLAAYEDPMKSKGLGRWLQGDLHSPKKARRRELRGRILHKKVLLAYDGSIEGRRALREGAKLAQFCGAEVFLLAVVEISSGTVTLEGGFASSVEEKMATC